VFRLFITVVGYYNEDESSPLQLNFGVALMLVSAQQKVASFFKLMVDFLHE